MRFEGSTILILEDEPIIGLALEDMLAGKGARVLHASRIEEAEELLSGQQVDSAVLDVNVHGILSYPVAARLAERAIPFIFATGYGDRSHPPEFAAVPTVSKPYSAEEICRALIASGCRPNATNPGICKAISQA
jgi:CheY-like chemotaxis protein